MSTPAQIWGSVPFGGPVEAISVGSIIYRGYRIAGLITSAGRGASVSEMKDGLSILNSMVDQWKTQSLMVWAILRSLQPLTPFKQAYLVGFTSDADWHLERPEKIERAGLVMQSSSIPFEIPLDIINEQQWQAITTKELQSTIPQRLWYEPTPIAGTVWIWPLPTIVNQIALYTWQNLQEFDSVEDKIATPPGYRKALEYNLARALAENFPTRQKMSPSAIQQANEALGWCKNVNNRPLLQQVEHSAMGLRSGQSGHWSPYTNTWIK